MKGDTPGSRLDYDFRQQDWGHAHPWPFTRHEPHLVELHHSVIPTGNGDAVYHARAIQSIHLAKNWNGVFYNVGVHARSGDVVELRGEGNLSTSDARDALTVVVFGDLRTDRISAAASESLRKILWHYDGPIRGHRERPYPTQCPAEQGMAFVDAVRDGTLKTIPPYTPEPDPPPLEDEENMLRYIYAEKPDGTKTARMLTNGIHRWNPPAGQKRFMDKAGWTRTSRNEPAEKVPWSTWQMLRFVKQP